MRISLNWLRELVDLTMTPQELAEKLTMAGFEVEDIEDRRTWAEGVVVGRVLERKPHPNADKLSVCQVDIGAATPSTIVCGAANVRADIYVPVATLGTHLPVINLTIRPRKLRDVPSEGMICSLAEVGLAKESAGIHIFPQENLTVGSDARPLLGLDDVILDLTSTANRADALSMVGVAREVAALTGAKLKLPEIPDSPVNPDGTDLALRIAETTACPVYIGTIIDNVKIGPSPEWLQRRLQAAGTRPINNVVDITNYVLLEWGQPLHAFDRDRLQSVAKTTPLTIGVRFAQNGETLTTLDSQNRTLQEQALLITANDRPVALAGVMGGEETEVHADTQNLMLEAALFDSVSIRRSARSQALRTEASSRYERGVNPAELQVACRRALQLITELAGGTVGTQVIADARPSQAATRTIELRLERLNQVLGPINLKPDANGSLSEDPPSDDDIGELQAEDVERTLSALGCQLTLIEDGVWNVTVPPYRYRDMEREIDLIEEVARLYGYNNFCDTLPAKTEPGYLSIEQALTQKIHAAFRAVGLTEVMHYSLVKPTGSDEQIVLSNPLFVEYSALRTELLSALIDAFQYNLEQGNGALNAFEIGRVFWREEDGLSEMDMVAGILGGDPSTGRWVRGGREQSMTWYEAKGILERVFQYLGLTVEYQPDRRNSLLHPGRTASLWIQGDRLGTFGQLHPQVRQERGLPDEVYVFELHLDALLKPLEREESLTPLFKPYSSYPSSDRDIAFFAPVQFSVAEIERAVKKVGGALLESVELFDEYRGENVPEGKRSLAFRLVYRSGDRTLTDDDVEPVHQKVRETLEEKFRASLRS
ncbi:MAG TPA: phenylalanine--tRNA ligase subunit beta [Crinalium sp.]|jgi:phenylalanyl-tRNA synthetase beta chain